MLIKNIKKIFLCFLVLLVCATSINYVKADVEVNRSFANHTLNIKFMATNSSSIAGLTCGADDKYNVKIDGYTMSGCGGEVESLAHFIIDGNEVYCINPLIGTADGEVYFEDVLDTKLNLLQQRALKQIAYLGYGFQGDKSTEMKAATQLLIWEYLGYVIHNIHPDIQKRIDEIKGRVANWTVLPSFDSSSIVLKGYGKAYAQTVTDTNGVFHEYLDYTNGGFHYERNGDSLKIWVEEGDALAGTISFSRVAREDLGMSIAYSSPKGMQDLVYLQNGDPIDMKINVSVAKGGIALTKQDEDGNKIADTVFRISKKADMSDSIGTYTTGVNGSVSVNELLPGTYYVQEISVPAPLILDSTIHTMQVVGNEVSKYTAVNKYKKGSVQIQKIDVDSNNAVKKANVEFKIYKSDGTYITTVLTNTLGIATLGDLRYGDYYFIEMKAPVGYIVNSTPVHFSIREHGAVVDTSISNKRVSGSLSISKTDKETGSVAQGDASLEGAVYGLYAKEAILASDSNSILFNKDQEVSRLTIQNGKANIQNLYLGEYYLKEIQAPIGYLLDTTIYPVHLQYANQNQSIIVQNKNLQDVVKKQAFTLIKIGSDGSTAETPALEGAEFTVKLQSEINQKGWALAKTFDVLKTDKKGYAKSIELPYGTYTVRETKTPPNHQSVADFAVTINADSREPQAWRIFNDAPFKAIVAIVKKDAQTGKHIAIADARFKIYNLDKKEYVGQWAWNPLPHYIDEFATTEDGTVMTPSWLLPGHYQLEEVKAPQGYLLSKTPIPFEISSNIAYQTGPDGVTPIITVTKSDEQVKGKIKVYKEGEVLMSIERNDKENVTFQYETQKLKNATFAIYADGDIESPDRQGTILYHDQEIVAEITTDETGEASSEELPLGNYLVKEKLAPDGYVINHETHEVSLTYADQMTAIVFDDTQFVNDRQSVKLEVLKQDSELLTPLTGASFALYADADISDVNGAIIVHKDEKIEMAQSDEQGLVTFQADLPLSTYYVTEVEAPNGYVKSDEVLLFDASYQGQDIEQITLQQVFSNTMTSVEISKSDITTGIELAGAHLRILDQDQKVVESWISDRSAHHIRGLEVGKTYTLEETSAPYGFAITQSISFTITDTLETQKIEMKDNLVGGQLTFTKKGEAFTSVTKQSSEYGETWNPIWEMMSLPGAQISIYAAEDIILANQVTYYEKDELVEQINSAYNEVASSILPVGSYYWKESKAPYGYLLDKQLHYFEIENSQSEVLQVVQAEFENRRSRLIIDFMKLIEESAFTNDAKTYEQVLFGVYAKMDILNVHKEITIPADQLIMVTGIKEDGSLKETLDLPDGSYYLKELKTDDRYVLDENSYGFEVAYKGETQEYNHCTVGDGAPIENTLKRGRIELLKQDEESKVVLAGITFELSRDPDFKTILQSKQSDEHGIVNFDNLEIGTYYIKETKTDYYHILDQRVHVVEISKHQQVETKTIQNRIRKSLITIHKTNKEKTPLGGVEFALYDDKKQLLIQAITDEQGNLVFDDIRNGQYFIKETKPLTGYFANDEWYSVLVEGNHEGEEYHIEVENDKYETSVLGVKTGDHTQLPMMSITLSLGAILFLAFYKLRKKN